MRRYGRSSAVAAHPSAPRRQRLLSEPPRRYKPRVPPFVELKAEELFAYDGESGQFSLENPA